MKDYRIEIVPWEEADLAGYRAEHPELPGCTALGRTPEEALAALRLARADWIRRAREEGREVPAPTWPREQEPTSPSPPDERSPEERLGLDAERLSNFCRRWRIGKLWLFGSALRSDFGPGSDVDVLVEFEDGEHWSLSDLCQMEVELESWFGRPVDLIEPRQLVNPRRRDHILSHRRLLHEAS